jgi:hypothetical protein
MTMDKNLVRDTLSSLKDANRKILEANGIAECVDDYVYLSIRLA